MPKLCLFVLFLLPLAAQDKGRVFLISLDGLGFQALNEDPAASELKTMRRIATDGISAPMQGSFPSLTAASHASIFTGVYGNKNGITANDVPVTPRAEHKFTERANGFRAEQLRSEMFWVKPAREGLRVVAHNTTQGFPCNALNSGPNITLVNGYQTDEIAPERLLRGKDVNWLDAPALDATALPKSTLPLRHFEYKAGSLHFAGIVYARGKRYDGIRVSADGGKRYADSAWKDTEIEPLGTRPPARYFSEALPVGGKTAVHFRLFELSTDGRDFLLYQSQAKELSVCGEDGDRFRSKLLATAGAFVGNGAGALYWRDALGSRFTDGLAERRFLETLELHARQTMRHTRALVAQFDPQLIVDYLSTADDMLHDWWGLAARNDRFIEPYRRWGYQIVDWRVRELKALMKLEDHLVIVSDHGMAAMEKEIRVNRMLADWGHADRVVAQDYFLVVNRKAWLGGTVEDDEVQPLLDEVKTRLSAYRDGDKAVFTAFFTPDAAQAKYGVGGDAGGDLYFDLAPGYRTAKGIKGEVLVKLPYPVGSHGPPPTRPELMSIFLAIGPGIDRRPASLRSIDVAPFVLRLLGF